MNPFRDADPHDPVAEEAAGVAGPGGPAGGGACERRLQRAIELGLRHLARRERTVAQVRGHLESKDVDPEVAEAAIAEIARDGLLDDRRYARLFAEDRRRFDGWGADRIERRLLELGIEREDVAAVLAEGEHDELAAAVDVLRRRLRAVPETPRDRDRALGLLVRRGYDLELAHDAIRAHAREALEGEAPPVP